jgi:hypothetical protein
MKLNQQEIRKFRYYLGNWEEEGKISLQQKEELLDSLKQEQSDSASFDWKNLSFLSFFFAVVCIILATSLMVIDDWLEKILNYVLDVPEWVKSIMLFLISALLYYLALVRRAKYPNRVFSNEALFLFGAVCTAFAISYLGFSLNMYDGYFPVLILLAACIYGITGLMLDSSINWYLSLGAFALWFGTETAYRSGWEDYFLGMNYPMRYLLFGVLLIGLHQLLKKAAIGKKFINSTYAIGLLSLFFSFWLLSIFGNHTDLDAWSEVSQAKFVYWALLLGIFASGAIWYGLKYRDRIAREMGIIFLLLNIYTRYFEYFWDSLHKVVFFLILALSFWLLGRKAENIWSLAEKD